MIPGFGGKFLHGLEWVIAVILLYQVFVMYDVNFSSLLSNYYTTTSSMSQLLSPQGAVYNGDIVYIG